MLKLTLRAALGALIAVMAVLATPALAQDAEELRLAGWGLRRAARDMEADHLSVARAGASAGAAAPARCRKRPSYRTCCWRRHPAGRCSRADRRRRGCGVPAGHQIDRCGKPSS